MNTLQKRNYDAVVARGLITKETTDKQFLNKLEEDFYEAMAECDDDTFRLMSELADVITVCTCWMIHRGYDPDVLLRRCAEKNEKRIK